MFTLWKYITDMEFSFLAYQIEVSAVLTRLSEFYRTYPIPITAKYNKQTGPWANKNVNGMRPCQKSSDIIVILKICQPGMSHLSIIRNF